MPRDPPVTMATWPRSDCIAITIIHPMQEVAIVGAGELGGAVAHVLARRDAVRSIVLADESGRVAAGKALDIAQPHRSKVLRRRSPEPPISRPSPAVQSSS